MEEEWSVKNVVRTEGETLEVNFFFFWNDSFSYNPEENWGQSDIIMLCI